MKAPGEDAQTLEKRKIYNTHLHSQGNGGHAFAAVLTDDERRALIEHLETL
jgi:endo-cleaving rubber dioxygenase